MEKGELLGKGMTAEVYRWGQDKVLKLFLNGYSEEWAKFEADIGRKIYEAGVSSPEVFETVEMDGRSGILFERITGKTLTSIILKKPWLFNSFVYQMAGFQYSIHKHSAAGIPSQKEKFTRVIELSTELLGDRTNKILNYIDRLPEKDNICHGDMYLSNIIKSNNRLVAIDWSAGYRGDPAGDVARTCLIINSPAVLPGTPDIMAAMSRFPKSLTCQAYLNEYRRISKMKPGEIDAWILPVAAGKLKDKIPGEEKWLLKIIDQRLGQLEA